MVDLEAVLVRHLILRHLLDLLQNISRITENVRVGFYLRWQRTVVDSILELLHLLVKLDICLELRLSGIGGPGMKVAQPRAEIAAKAENSIL